MMWAAGGRERLWYAQGAVKSGLLKEDRSEHPPL